MMKFMLFAFVLWASLGKNSALADVESQIVEVYSNSIVKIDVSTIEPVFKDGKKVCISEGTGFLVSSNHVVTAAHVHQLGPECGTPTILIRSKKHKIETTAQVVGFKDDVSVLKSEIGFARPMCALRLFSKDTYGEKALRFGIPGSLLYPSVFHVLISEKENDFEPLAVLTPTAVEAGESGGPVVFQFNVVGITRAKHDKFSAFSVMTPGNIIRSLVRDLKIPLDGYICNPAEISYLGADNSISSIEIKPTSPFRSTIGNIFGKAISKASSDVIRAKKELDVNVRTQGSSTIIEFEQSGAPQANASATRSGGEAKNSSAPSSTIVVPSENPKDAAAVEAAADIQRKLELDLWSRLVEEGNRNNKWR